MATVIGEKPYSVTIDEVHKVVEGKLVKFHIRGTELYFVLWNAAKENAHRLVLKKRLSTAEFEAKMALKKRITKANSAIKVHTCLMETQKFVERWDGIISVENKKRLCADLNEKLNHRLQLAGFRNIGSAKGFVEKHKKK